MPLNHSIYRMIDLPSTLTIQLCLYKKCKNFKGIIISEYTSQLKILRHFPKIFSMIHICPLKSLQMLAVTLHYFYVRN